MRTEQEWTRGQQTAKFIPEAEKKVGDGTHPPFKCHHTTASATKLDFCGCASCIGSLEYFNQKLPSKIESSDF
jgi:hypothetical protein